MLRKLLNNRPEWARLLYWVLYFGIPVFIVFGLDDGIENGTGESYAYIVAVACYVGLGLYSGWLFRLLGRSNSRSLQKRSRE